ncbi:MAG: glycosyltransferase [Candidatus Scalinduaceae bacterium]
MSIKNIDIGNTSFLALAWVGFGIFIIPLYITFYIKQRKEVKIAQHILLDENPKQEKLIQYFNLIAEHRDNWKDRSKSYYDELLKILQFLIPPYASVIEIGCGTGDFLNQLSQEKVMGIDSSSGMIKKARVKYPDIPFDVMNAENIEPEKLNESYDYIIMSDLIGHLNDVQKAFEESKKLMHDGSRLIITYYSYLWEPILRILEKLYLKMPQFRQNWLSTSDIENLIELSGMEVVKEGEALLMPTYIPFFSWLLNKYFVKLPLFRYLALIQYFVVRKNNPTSQEYSLSVIIPARNEGGNIEKAVLRTPKIGKFTELIFVEGHSTDNTWEEIKRVYEKYKDSHKIKIMQQPGKGKGDAVRKGFSEATGDIVTILDGDLTMPPEELPKFYNVMANRQADFVNGCRLVYPPEKESMLFFNLLGNKFFSMAFTWLLDQPLKDTLCGTKMLLKKDYENIIANRGYFGNFDPYGDFDLLFGASKLNLKFMEIPIRYQARTYGETNIQRWRHGLLLLKMVFFAMGKIKFI